MAKVALLMMTILMVAAMSIGCDDGGLSEEEVRQLIKDEVTNQMTDLEATVSTEVTNQTANINVLISEEIAKQMVTLEDSISAEVKTKLAELNHLTLSGLEIRDSNGVTVAKLGNNPEGGFLEIYNSDSKLAATLIGSTQDGSMLSLNDTDGTTQAVLGASEGSQGWLELYNEEVTVAQLGAETIDGFGMLQLRNAHGDVVFQVASTLGDGHLWFFDRDGATTLMIP